MNAQQARAFLRWAKRVQRMALRVAGRECQRLADGAVAQLGMVVEIVPDSDCYRDYQGRPLRITSLLGRHCSLVQLGPIQVHTSELRRATPEEELSQL